MFVTWVCLVFWFLCCSSAASRCRPCSATSFTLIATSSSWACMNAVTISIQWCIDDWMMFDLFPDTVRAETADLSCSPRNHNKDSCECRQQYWRIHMKLPNNCSLQSKHRNDFTIVNTMTNVSISNSQTLSLQLCSKLQKLNSRAHTAPNSDPSAPAANLKLWALAAPGPAAPHHRL